MFLERVELRNFRAYRSAELALGPTGLTVVTGPNNSGKTALLSALDMVGGQLVEGPLRFAGATVGPEVQAVFAFDNDERRRLAETVEPVYRSDAEQAVVGAAFTFSEGRDGLPALALVRIAVLRSDGHQWPIAEAVLREDGYGSVRVVHWENWLKAWADKPDLSTAGAVQGSGLSRYLEQDHGAMPLTSALLAWRAGFYHFRSLRTGAAARITSTEHQPSLQSTGSNLGNYLQWLRGHREDQWEQIRATMRDLIPDVGRLQIHAAGNAAEVGFETSGLGFVNIKDVGTGVEQLLLTITVGQTSAASMLIVEEPETNLHPGAQRQLMAHLVDWSSQRPVLIATHSPVIMDSAGAGRLFEVSRTGIVSTVRLVQETAELADLLTRLGVRFSDVLGSERVLIVEGPTDRRLLEAWFPELDSHSTVSVVPGGGGAGVWQMRLMEDVSGAADRLPRPVLYLRDRDELSYRDLARLAKLPAVEVLSRRELENYLLDSAAIAKVLSSRTDARAPQPEEVASSLRTAAESLRDRVVTSRVLENAECLGRLLPVATDERKGIYRANDPAAELLTLVRGKLQGRLLSLDQCIRDAFEKEKAWVAERWPDDWKAIVPGADVLAAVFAPFGGYSKDADGPMIAKAIGEPPTEIADILLKFLAK